jgi:CO dehydrogenase/acetyl-CoA synthase beta subunit
MYSCKREQGSTVEEGKAEAVGPDIDEHSDKVLAPFASTFLC